MKYTIVYSSKTGNTAELANCVAKALPKEDCVYCGGAEGNMDLSDFIFVGFWTDKGTCDEKTAAFLKSLKNKRVFLFGTAGFGGDDAYFAQIRNRVLENLDFSNTVAGSYMCQGKMPLAVRKRYEGMLETQPEKMGRMIENFDRAATHPTEKDLEGLAEAVKAVL